ncbi:concanavalin A-like lectin/glucanase domain-containing protein [Cladorrhinum sp. PSN332]|nr:concanavalin A-like lectin/glucanase domain-containing protein [Cladorrhinum sp. PSN332]
MPTDNNNNNNNSLMAMARLVAAASLAAVARGAYPLTTDSNCGCYKTNTTVTNYFGYHQFFDFRSLSQYVNVTKPIDDFDGNAFAPPTSSYFTSPAWTSYWSIMNWNNTALMAINDTTVNDATVPMVNSPNNIYIERNTDPGASSADTFLTLRTRRHRAPAAAGAAAGAAGGPEPGFQSSAEIESRSTGYQFLSIRMLARTKGASGAVTAMFTYRPPPPAPVQGAPQNLSLVQEADLEIRTRDPETSVQYTNQPSWNAFGDIPAATKNVTLPGRKKWTEWVHYRMDWTPGSSTWFVDGNLVAGIKFQAPRDPAMVLFNCWSDGGSWSGVMGEGEREEEAVMQVKWVDMVFNDTERGPVKGVPAGGRCGNVCSIDETTRLGTPVLMTGDGAPSNGNGPSQPTAGPVGGGGGCQSAKYGQCAGKTWNGCKSCASGSTCRFQNDYYSQCFFCPCQLLTGASYNRCCNVVHRGKGGTGGKLRLVEMADSTNDAVINEVLKTKDGEHRANETCADGGKENFECQVTVQPNMMSFTNKEGKVVKIHIPTGSYARAAELFIAEDWEELEKFPAWNNQQYTAADYIFKK